jgi:hypothetical protein
MTNTIEFLLTEGGVAGAKINRNVVWRTLGLFLVCLSLGRHGAFGGYAEQLSLKSDFIFKGTVQKVNSSTLSAVPATESTAVVRVDEIVQAKAPDDSFKGKDITVLLGKPDSVKVGQQAIFFTNDYLAGDSIAVREMGQVPAKTMMGPVSIQSAVKSAAQEHALDPLRKRIETSVAIIEGKVVSTKPLPTESNKPKPDREPEWWTAIIQVQVVYKGSIPDKEILIRFSNNDALPGSPKFREGQQGIFLLHHEKARMLPAEILVALDELDFQPSSNSSLIKETIQLGSIVATPTPISTTSP